MGTRASGPVKRLRSKAWRCRPPTKMTPCESFRVAAIKALFK